MANVTVTTIDALIAEMISKDIFLDLENKTYMAGLVFRRDAPHGVDKVSYPFIGKLAAVDKVAGTPLTPAANTETALDISLDKHKAVPILIEKIAEVQTDTDLRKMYTSRMAEALGTVVDTDLFALYAGLSQTIGTGIAAITDADIRDGVQLLDEANAPAERYLMISPSQKNAILGIAKFVETWKSGSNMLLTGEIGNIYGVRVIVSNNCPVVTTTVKCIMFASDAFGLSIQEDISVNGQYNVLAIGTDVVADMIYGVAELRDDFGVLIDCLN